MLYPPASKDEDSNDHLCSCGRPASDCHKEPYLVKRKQAMSLQGGIYLWKTIAGREFQFLLLAIFLGRCFASPSLASDTLFKGDSIPTNGSLVSKGGIFKLGFFIGGPSRGYYLGIWYNNISVNTVVWVANRKSPVDETGSFRISNYNDLQVVGGSGEVLWSSNSTLDNTNCSAQIQDNGNLVLTSKNDQKSILWQSFDHPTDTFLPNMELTMDPSTGETLKLVSWKSPDDPTPGRFSLSLDPKGSGQLFIWNGSEIWWRSGQWNKKSFIGLTRMKALYLYGFSLVVQDGGKMVLSFNYYSPFLRFVMQWDGIENTSLWTPENNSWTGIWLQPLTDCETYNFCGNYSLCEDGKQSTKCGCVQGFSPKIEGDARSECVRRTPLICGQNATEGELGYARLEQVKVPDFSEWASSAADETTCRAFCSANCSCKAYSYVEDVGCLIWAVDLVDLAKLPSNGSTLFLKLDSRDLDFGGGENKTKVLWIVLPIVLCLILFLSIYFGWKYKAKIEGWKVKGEGGLGSSIVQTVSSGDGQTQSSKESQDQSEDSLDLPLYTFDDIAAATDGFSNDNKLGQGGFGVVHKGVLPSGEVIAVKRLSKNSCQGLDELKNEVKLIANLQHRNLVKLLGYCFEGDEKILVYEYMPNKSLDFLLFDPERQSLLDWSKRFDIIEGIARGLLYLHRDSRLRIVHRDLKASNILLDEEMNPKISDFGMARIFGGNQIHDNTNRVVGTFGYMSPEYAMEGLFSAKSDVYSFGVLILEIVSGKRNARTRSEDYTNLIGYAWQLWADGRPEDLIDHSIRIACDVPQAVRCIHVGLLCVQNLTRDRPPMASVVILLSSQNPIQQSPNQPTFLIEGSRNDTIIEKLNEDRFTVNDVTITTIIGR